MGGIHHKILETGFLVSLAKIIQIISRLCPGQKSHSPGYIANKQILHQKSDAKGVLKSQEYKTWKKIVSI